MSFWHRLIIAAAVFAAITLLARLLDMWLVRQPLAPEAVTRYRVLRRTVTVSILVVGFFSALLVIPQVRAIAGMNDARRGAREFEDFIRHAAEVVGHVDAAHERVSSRKLRNHLPRPIPRPVIDEDHLKRPRRNRLQHRPQPLHQRRQRGFAVVDRDDGAKARSSSSKSHDARIMGASR